MTWEVHDTGIHSAEGNMRYDAELLDKADTFSSPILHFYEWEDDAATYGHLVNPEHFLNLEQAAQRKLSLARRSTGGGIVFHLWDMAFSALVPAHLPQFSLNTLENYALINRAVLESVRELLQVQPSLTPLDFATSDASCARFCMARPTKYDVVLDGKKVAGAAQRKTRKGFLHQGTIALVMPSEEYLADVLLPGTDVLAAMMRSTYPILGPKASLEQIQRSKRQLRTLLEAHLNQQTT